MQYPSPCASQFIEIGGSGKTTFARSQRRSQDKEPVDLAGELRLIYNVA
jgi:hypothetical protein